MILVGAYKNFSDSQWDGEPVEYADIYESTKKEQIKSFKQSGAEALLERPKKQKVKIKLAPGKEREIQYMSQTSFWDASGIPNICRAIYM